MALNSFCHLFVLITSVGMKIVSCLIVNSVLVSAKHALCELENWCEFAKRDTTSQEIPNFQRSKGIHLYGIRPINSFYNIYFGFLLGEPTLGKLTVPFYEAVKIDSISTIWG